MKALLALIVLSANALAAPAQCQNGKCLPGGNYVIPPASFSAAGTPASSAVLIHGWHRDAHGTLSLYWHGENVGTLATATDGKPILPVGKASVPKECVCKEGKCECKDCPRNCVAVKPTSFETVAGEDPFPGGVDRNAIKNAPTYQCSGRVCSKHQAYQFLAAASLVDDKDKAFLTIVADESTRKRFLADLQTSPAFAPYRGKLHVNAYDPSDWHVAQVGLQPGVSYQGPPNAAGESPVEWRFRTYAGPEATVEAIRKVNPAYKPESDPDPKAPVPAPPPPKSPDDKSPPAPASPMSPAWQFLLTIAGLAAAAIAAAWWSRRK